MAKKKTNRKPIISSKNKTTAKNKPFGKISALLIVITVVITLGTLTFFGINYNKKGKIHLENIAKIDRYLENMLPDELENDLDLPTTLQEYQNIQIDWSSSSETVLSKLGKVTRPAYDSPNKIITMRATFTIVDDGFLADVFYQLFGVNHIVKEYQIIVLKKVLTDQDKIDLASSYLYVPEFTISDIGLITAIPYLAGLSISWSSTNPSVMTNTGLKLANGKTKLMAILDLNGLNKTLEYEIEVRDKLEDINALYEDFGNISGGPATKDWSEINFSFHRANIYSLGDDIEPGELSQHLRLNAEKDNAAYLLMNYDIINPTSLIVSYALRRVTTINRDIIFSIYFSIDEGVNWQLKQDYKLTDAEDHQITLDVTGLEKARFKIELATEYADDEVLIYDLEIKRLVSDLDIENSLNSLVYQKVKEFIVLPKTTPYGGVVTWVSHDEDVITNSGFSVKRTNKTRTVSMVATININDRILTISYDITVVGFETVTPVEVFFIDIGKYGTSDAGEAIYIKIDEIDILVDAGQHSTSFQAISEVIDENSQDKIIDYVIATHPDADHIGNMPKVFERYQILNVIQFYGEHTSNLYKAYKEAIKNEKLVSECTVTDSVKNTNGCKKDVELKPEVVIELIDTSGYLEKESNSRSIVFLLQAYGTKILFTGDADNGSIKTLESSYMNQVGDIDILKVVHHGTKEGTTGEFLKAIDPEVAIITNGNYLGNKHGHPTADAINRIYQYDSKITIFAVVGGGTTGCAATSSGAWKCENKNTEVDRNGTIKISIDESGYKITASIPSTPIEISSTIWWKNHKYKGYEYQRG